MVDVRRLPVGEDNDEVRVTLDGLAREGARRMMAAARHDDRCPIRRTRWVEAHVEYWPERPERQSRDEITPVEI